MKFTIAKEHRDYYSKNGMIELEGLIKAEAIEKFFGLTRHGLAKRLEILPESLQFRPSEELFVAGRDLWREDSGFKTLLRQRYLGEIASELFRTRSLRLAFTQFLPSHYEVIGVPTKSRTLMDFIEKQPTLKDFSCVQGTVGGLMLCLKGDGEKTNTVLPSKVGDGVFFSADAPMDLDLLKTSGENRYLLITYALPTSVYILNSSDPHLHFLKKYDYNFGDKLLDRLHPIVYR